MTNFNSNIKNRVYKKILKDDGASVVLALVGFLIVCFVAIAIANAAILNARRTLEEKKEEIAYIATTEAANRILEKIDGDISYKKTEGVSEAEIEGADEALLDSIKQMADAIAGGSGSTEKNISFDYTGLEKIDGSLNGKIKMDDSYMITIDIWVDSGKTNYPLTLIIPGEGQTIEEEIPGTLNAEGKRDTRKVTYASWSGDGAYIISKIKE